MNHNFILTELENQNLAAEKALLYGYAAILTLGTSLFDENCVDLESGVLTERPVNIHEIWTFKVSDLVGYESMTYADTNIENELLNTGAFYQPNLLAPCVYALTPNVAIVNTSEVLFCARDILQKYDNFATVVLNDLDA